MHEGKREEEKEKKERKKGKGRKKMRGKEVPMRDLEPVIFHSKL